MAVPPEQEKNFTAQNKVYC